MSEAERPLLGKTLGGRFTITGFVGEGAMASVYRGKQDEEPRDLAVKVMHPSLANDATFVKRFWREAKAAARLKHPNTVQILEYGVDSGTVFIAMEFLDGQDLFDVLAKDRRFSEQRAASVALQILDALSSAHEHGIVHRDLKPENVMILKDPADPTRDLVKVLDFGIAKILDRDVDSEGPPSSPMSSVPSSALTKVGTIVGTPEYMSPEQCRGDAIDARSDVYAVGVLLYRLLTGRTPFVGDSPIDIAMKHLTDDPAPPSTLLSGLNAGLEKAILTSLAKWPAQRQQSAKELSDEIRALLPELSGLSRHSGRIVGSASKVAAMAAEAAGKAPGSDPGAKRADLPGLPDEVIITAEQRSPKRSSPPAERSKTPAAPMAELAKTLPVSTGDVLLAREALKAAKATAVEADKAPAGTASPDKVSPAEAPPEPAVAPLAKRPEAPKAPVTVRRPEPVHGGLHAIPGWVFAAVIGALCVVIYVVRALRFP